MLAPFDQGAVLLAPVEKTDAPGGFRLVWGKGEAGAAREVPVGRYRVRNYAIEAEHESATWVLSASGKAGADVVVEEGKETRIEIDRRVHVKLTAVTGKGLAVNLGIFGDSHMGLSLFRDGKRVDVSYSVVDEGGNERANGPLAYG